MIVTECLTLKYNLSPSVCLHVRLYLPTPLWLCDSAAWGASMQHLWLSVWVMGQGKSLWLLNGAQRIIMRRAERLLPGSGELCELYWVGPVDLDLCLNWCEQSLRWPEVPPRGACYRGTQGQLRCVFGLNVGESDGRVTRSFPDQSGELCSCLWTCRKGGDFNEKVQWCSCQQKPNNSRG